MPQLLLGPVLRRVGHREAVLWVECDQACEVEVLGHREPTFHVEGHHYALVHVSGLEPGTETPYEVRLDGDHAWPPTDGHDDLPSPTIRTWRPGDPFHLLLGSCHQVAPERGPFDQPRSHDRRGLGPDALVAYALAVRDGTCPRPDALLLVGDQVYADETHPAVDAALESRRGHPPPAGWPQVTSFEEYTWLYQASWSPPTIRWLFSCVPVAMIFDDHDIIDDWNTSAAWREQVAELPWWPGRIRGGLMAYWLYQHLGNVAGEEEQDRELLAQVRDASDEAAVLDAFAQRADRGTAGGEGHRWSYRLDVGPCRLVVVDSRNGRVLDEGARAMVDDDEWAWLEEQLTGDVDHLVVASSLPWLLPPAIHDLEAWDERLAGGAWGRPGRAVGERLRQAVDLEHWSAFGRSFQALGDALAAVARGERGRAPATVLVLSGDVHFAYVAEPRWPGAVSRAYQVVSSPLRQGVPTLERRVQQALLWRPVTALARWAARRSPAAGPALSWEVTAGPWFDNNIALLRFDGGAARLTLHVARLGEAGHPQLEAVLERDL